MVTAALAFVAAATGSAGLALLTGSGVPRSWSDSQTKLVSPRVGRLLLVLAVIGRRLRPPGAPTDLRGRIEAAMRSCPRGSTPASPAQWT